LACLTLTACDQSTDVQVPNWLDSERLARAEVLITTGDTQEAAVGGLLSEALVVQVLDTDGTAIPGAPVTWTFGSGRGGGVGNTSRSTQLTLVADEQGLVAVEWEMGTRSGTQQAWAEVGTVSTVTTEELSAEAGPAQAGKGNGGGQGRGKKVRFAANTTPAEPAQILVSQTSLTLDVGETVALTATVVDKYGNVIPDAVVQWTSSDPSVANVQSPSASPPLNSFASRVRSEHSGLGQQ
jgi:hypothetical protein